jgi:hypothetical protein
MLMILHVLSEAYVSGSFIRHTMPHLFVCEISCIRAYYSTGDNGLHFILHTWSFIVRRYGQGMFVSDRLRILKFYIVYRQNLTISHLLGPIMVLLGKAFSFHMYGKFYVH